MSAEILRVPVSHGNDALVVEVVTPLTRTELSRMGQLEEVLQRNMQSFVEVGNALKEIRDGRYYRQTYDTFEAYCKGQWGMSKPYATQTIGAFEVRSNLVAIATILPTTESQCRPLTSLSPETQQQAWARALEIAGDSQPTARIVSEAVAELFPKPEPSPAESGEDDSEQSTSLTWPEALKAASRKKQITSAEVAEMLGVALPDVRKSLSVMDKAFGYQVHRLNNEGLFSVTKAPTDQDAIVETFGKLSANEKMALLRKLSGDPDVMRIRGEKQTQEMRKGDKATAIEAASSFIEQAGHELHKYQTNFGSHFGWLAKAMKTEQGVSEVMSMIGRLDRIANDSVAYSKALNERTKDV